MKVTLESFFTKLANTNTSASSDGNSLVILISSTELWRHVTDQLNGFQATSLGASFSTIEVESYEGDKNKLMSLLHEANEDSALVVVLGASTLPLKATFDHLQLRQKTFSVASFRRSFGLNEDLLYKMQEVAKPWMRDQAVLGLQRHLDHSSNVDIGGQLRKLSLAAVQQNISLVEPILRRADVVNIDLQGALGGGHPIGLSCQELAQAAHYAGRGTKTQFLTILDDGEAKAWTHEAMAVILWYFLLGVTFRRPPEVTKMRRYTLEGEIENRKLIFMQDEVTQHWWFTEDTDATGSDLLPCNYSDYELASKSQELSDHLQYLLSV